MTENGPISNVCPERNRPSAASARLAPAEERRLLRDAHRCRAGQYTDARRHQIGQSAVVGMPVRDQERKQRSVSASPQARDVGKKIAHRHLGGVEG